MRYLRIDDIDPSSSPPPPWWLRFLQRIIPAANPDIEKYYSRTQYWWLEIDDKGLPHREIGFDIDQNPIVLGPVGGNYGLLVDSSIDWKDYEGDSEEAKRRFEEVWDNLYEKFKHLEIDKNKSC